MEQGDIFGKEASVVLTNDKIHSMIESGNLIARDTFDSSLLESCSYDIRIGDFGVSGGTGQEIDLKNEGLELQPGGYAGLISLERLKLPLDVFARLGSKRSYSYDGIILLTGSVVDPGYEGHLLFGVYNASQKKHVLRRGGKICVIVFEKLSSKVDKRASTSPDLLQGRFPDDFINKMANMEVLPWMKISERVRQIEQMASDILDLKKRYEDVLEPIKALTQNVDRISQDVEKLTLRTSELREVSKDNADQLRQVVANLSSMTTQIGTVSETARRAENLVKEESDRVTDISVRFGRFSLAVYIFWALVLVGLGSALPWLINLITGN